jgi:hypothetical protein
MRISKLRPILVSVVVLLFLLAAAWPLSRARADVAPPEQPPGSNPFPGNENTQVRMVAETVTLVVLPVPSSGSIGQAKTEAVFIMHNLGTVEERMDVRFPLSFWDGRSDGFFNYPEIQDFRVSVDGRSLATTRITSPNSFQPGGPEVPWATFPVSFPPGRDVLISVTYTSDGYGYDPFFALRYILETGAGWKDTIGAADIIVKLPYDATEENTLLAESTGFSQTSGTPVFSGREIRWHFENFEPTAQENIEISLLIPSYWQKVLKERENVSKNPADGEAWGRLGKAIKESIRYSKGYLRADPAGQALYAEAVTAYDKAVTLLPGDPLWHYGFADLLWSSYYLAWDGPHDIAELYRAVDEIHQSITLDPSNQNALDLAGWIAGSYPWAISRTEHGFEYLILTATPTSLPATETPSPEPTLVEPATVTPALDVPTVSPTDSPPGPTPVPQGGNPLCGGAAALLPIAALLALKKRTIFA